MFPSKRKLIINTEKKIPSTDRRKNVKWKMENAKRVMSASLSLTSFFSRLRGGKSHAKKRLSDAKQKPKRNRRAEGGVAGGGE